jgi:CheY-like chemotaxis protein
MQPLDNEGSPPAAGAAECHVLVVDDDPDCLEEYAEIVDWYGYRCWTAADARAALKLIAENPQIGIVVTDLQMPGMDGISFLDVLANRYSALRPLVPLVVTGFGSIERAVEAMRHNAVDFLAKPVSRESFSEALLRAARRWAQLFGEIRLAEIAGPKLVPEVEAEAPTAPAPDMPGNAGRGAPGSPEEMLGLVRAIVRSRQKRSDFLDSELFADPAWDILLDLTSAKLEGKVVPVSSACAASNVPMTTALRYIRHLVDAGLVKRWKDKTDARRFLLELEDETMEAMMRYIADVGPRLAQQKG